MIELSFLRNTTREQKRCKIVGRGPGSGMGKTSCRGQKGDGARSGYKRRLGKEGGQKPLYMKLPIRGFTRGRFLKKIAIINLMQVERSFSDGETVSVETLREKGFLNAPIDALKLLGFGELTKKVSFEVNQISTSAKEKLEKAGLTFKLV